MFKKPIIGKNKPEIFIPKHREMNLKGWLGGIRDSLRFPTQSIDRPSIEEAEKVHPAWMIAHDNLKIEHPEGSLFNYLGVEMIIVQWTKSQYYWRETADSHQAIWCIGAMEAEYLDTNGVIQSKTFQPRMALKVLTNGEWEDAGNE